MNETPASDHRENAEALLAEASAIRETDPKEAWRLLQKAAQALLSAETDGGNQATLEEVIAIHRDALRLVASEPDRRFVVASHINLAALLATQGQVYEKDGASFDEAVSEIRQALRITFDNSQVLKPLVIVRDLIEPLQLVLAAQAAKQGKQLTEGQIREMIIAIIDELKRELDPMNHRIKFSPSSGLPQ